MNFVPRNHIFRAGSGWWSVCSVSQFSSAPLITPRDRRSLLLPQSSVRSRVVVCGTSKEIRIPCCMLGWGSTPAFTHSDPSRDVLTAVFVLAFRWWRSSSSGSEEEEINQIVLNKKIPQIFQHQPWLQLMLFWVGINSAKGEGWVREVFFSSPCATVLYSWCCGWQRVNFIIHIACSYVCLWINLLRYSLCN